MRKIHLRLHDTPTPQDLPFQAKQIEAGRSEPIGSVYCSIQSDCMVYCAAQGDQCSSMESPFVLSSAKNKLDADVILVKEIKEKPW